MSPVLAMGMSVIMRTSGPVRMAMRMSVIVAMVMSVAVAVFVTVAVVVSRPRVMYMTVFDFFVGGRPCFDDLNVEVKFHSRQRMIGVELDVIPVDRDHGKNGCVVLVSAPEPIPHLGGTRQI